MFPTTGITGDALFVKNKLNTSAVNSNGNSQLKQYALRVLIGLDQFTNTIFGGYPNETLSARAWRRGNISGQPAWKMFQQTIDVMFSPVQANHCELSYLYFQKPIKTCGIYYPIYMNDSDKHRFLPIDLPLHEE